MAKRDSAARRYAEAAFQVAERDGTVEAWRRELDAAGTIVSQAVIGRTLSNPAIALETRAAAVNATFGRVASQPVTNLIQLMLRRGRIEDVPRVAAEFRRLDNARQGITIAKATSAAPLSQDEVAALTSRLEAFTGGRIDLDRGAGTAGCPHAPLRGRRRPHPRGLPPVPRCPRLRRVTPRVSHAGAATLSAVRAEWYASPVWPGTGVPGRGRHPQRPEGPRVRPAFSL